MNPSQQEMLAKAQILSEKAEYEQALACVEDMKCVMGEWARGKIYLDSAINMSSSFMFKHYPTPELKSKYRDILNASYTHLQNAGQMLIDAPEEIKQELNKYIWYQIGKVENELAATRVIVEQEDNDLTVDECDDAAYYQRQTEYLIDDISEWSLQMEE